MSEGPALTEDSLLDGRVRLRQPAGGYRAAIDPVLLAAAVPAEPGETVADLGCGVASAGLCLLRRLPRVRVVGLEVQPRLVALARQNGDLNDVGPDLAAHLGDVRDPPACFATGRFDHVMMNPPYLDPAAARVSHDTARRIATVEGAAGLDDWMRCAIMLLRPKGSLTLIHRADRLAEVLTLCAETCGSLTVLPLWPRLGEPAKRVIVQARKGSGAPLRLLPGLVLHRDDGAYSTAAEAVLRSAKRLEL